MAKRAPVGEKIDPVRSSLAASVAAAAPPREAPPAVTPPAPETPPSPPPPKSQATKAGPAKKAANKPKVMTVNRKFMVTPEEGEQMDATLRAISDAFGSKVTYSQTSRALWVILANIEDGLKAAGRGVQKRSLPSTGDALGMAEYEEAVTDFLIAALKRS